ncbi:MAG: efflux RND transporter periplasmic adaptor subunit [Candidatus Methylomirabilis oxygeniifera]|uniref:Putative Heavy metal efflux pump, CzcB family n=1 Tax=Methylomirabilis oxygeniifera TaxID=671143 RepID=D5MGS2_METO1|nr:MAG: efflux RND transporter periplasmic adaptor subunit [Candidatus Methylomirabilis oxyfera]CBE68953.1 putative Heavy metal efflux pump, CzcB family [Candidatus Methylomirabilis oxyfera]
MVYLLVGLARRVTFLPIVIVAVAILGACSRAPEQKPAAPASKPEPDTVTISTEAQVRFGFAVARPQRITPVRFIEATAAIAPDPARVSHIAPIAKGRIERVYVQVGDAVNQGTPLFGYDNIELGEAIGDYRGELAELQKDLALMEHHREMWERAKLLLEKEAIARKEVHIRETEYLVEKAAVESRYARIARAREKLIRFGMTNEQIEGLVNRQERALPPETSHTIVRAPISGVIIKREGAPGEVVGPEKELLAIADLTSIWTLVDIYEKDLGQVRRGTAAEINVEAYPGETFRGTISYVSDLLDPDTRTAKARVEIPNPQRKLKLGMFATVRLRARVADGTEAVTAIPSTAIQQIDGQPSVFVKLNPTTFQRRKVKLGPASGDLVEIAEGLKEDEQLVTTGSFTLKSEFLKEQLAQGEGQ